MLRLDGETVAALYEQMKDQRDAGIPPNWFSYITVADADATSARAKELGGSIHAGPFDVMTQGRMAVIADPAGAMFGVWQARDSIGATLVNDPGCLTMNEISTNDAVAPSSSTGTVRLERRELDTQDAPPYWAIRHGGGPAG